MGQLADIGCKERIRKNVRLRVVSTSKKYLYGSTRTVVRQENGQMKLFGKDTYRTYKSVVQGYMNVML